LTNAFLNSDFLIPGETIGSAEDWTTTINIQGLGVPAFEQFGGLTTSERFLWFSTFAKILSAQGPFDVDNMITESITVATNPDNYFVISGKDYRNYLPPNSSVRATGVGLEGYWTVDFCDYDGSDTYIYVKEDVLASPVSNVEFPPLVVADIDGYIWPARVQDHASYPLTVGMSSGVGLSVIVDRGVAQDVTFSGGEDTAEEISGLIEAQVNGANSYVSDSGQVVVESETKESDSFITITNAVSPIGFWTGEYKSIGQWAQLWDVYFDNPAEATVTELQAIFSRYWTRSNVFATSSSAGQYMLASTTKQGSSASIRIFGRQACVLSTTSWPITARVSGVDDEITVKVNGGAEQTITLSEGATTGLEIAEDIQAFFNSNGYSGGATYLDPYPHVEINSSESIEVTGGTANVDIGFPSDLVYGTSKPALDMGFGKGYATGVDDVGIFEDWDDVTGISAIFGGASDISIIYELFDWTRIFDSLAEAGELSDAYFASWYDSPDLVRVSDAFEEGWGTEWLSTPSAQHYTPPGVRNGILSGSGEVEFPLNIKANRNILWVYMRSFSAPLCDTINRIALIPGTYGDANALVSNLNDQLNASALPPGHPFKFWYSDVSENVSKIMYGWNRDGNPDFEMYLATRSDLDFDKDARSSIGLDTFDGRTGTRKIMVPSGYYTEINGVPSTTPSSEWQDEDVFFWVDPDSRVYQNVIDNPATPQKLAVDKNWEVALFNQSVSLDNNYNDEFLWHYPYVDPGSFSPVDDALFNTDLGPGENFEDFDEGW
jgi:hypothetical protein